MRQYTEKEYVDVFGFSAWKFTRCECRWSNGEMTYCGCTRYLNKHARAYENCLNCGGYGIMPVPLSEVI
jgi:hypothetical protein